MFRSFAFTALAVLAVSACASAKSAEKFNYPQGYNFSEPMSACGHSMASFQNVDAYSNGADQGGPNCCQGNIKTGCAFQCVELSQRFFHQKHGTPPIWSGIVGAKDMCAHRPSGVSHTMNPKAGDIVVLNWAGSTYGHTGIFMSSGNGLVNILEQNASPTGQGSWKTSAVECYLTYGSGEEEEKPVEEPAVPETVETFPGSCTACHAFLDAGYIAGCDVGSFVSDICGPFKSECGAAFKVFCAVNKAYGGNTPAARQYACHRMDLC